MRKLLLLLLSLTVLSGVASATTLDLGTPTSGALVFHLNEATFDDEIMFSTTGNHLVAIGLLDLDTGTLLNVVFDSIVGVGFDFDSTGPNGAQFEGVLAPGDYSILTSGTTTGANGGVYSVLVAEIPEPGTVLLLGSGLLLLGVGGRKLGGQH